MTKQHKITKKTGERIIPEKMRSLAEQLLYLEHIFAYEYVIAGICKQNDVVLEVGCGEGYGTALLSQHVSKIIGLDVDQATAEHAARKYSDKNCLFQSYDGRKLPFENECFDTVISFQVIEHIKDDIGYLGEIFRVLKQGGKLCLTTPNRAHRLRPGQRPWNRFHVREYSVDDLRKLLQAEFPNVKVFGIDATDEVRAIELARVRQALTIASLDPLGLRRAVPEPLRAVLAGLLGRVVGKKRRSSENKASLDQYSQRNFFMVEEQVEASLGLFALCEK